MGSELILILVVIAGFSFDFTNGFHDTANAMATSIATGALKPKVAVVLSACLNFAGAFISISVAATIAKGIVNPEVLAGGNGLVLVLAALIGAMTWNLITWYFTIPSSSSHALIGGVIGATIAATASGEVNWHNLVQTVIVPAILSPFICGGVAVLGTYMAYRLIRRLGQKEARTGYRYGQICSASLVSLAHGTNDAQKTMGVISLALIAHGDISAAHFSRPVLGQVRLRAVDRARHRERRLADHQHDGQPDHERRVSAGIRGRVVERRRDPRLLLLRLPAVDDPGRVRRRARRRTRQAGQHVHWNVIGQMLSAWILTMPGAGVLGGVAWEIADLFGAHSNVGAIVIVALAAAGAFGLWTLAQRNKITPEDLDRTNVSVVEEAESPAFHPPSR